MHVSDIVVLNMFCKFFDNLFDVVVVVVDGSCQALDILVLLLCKLHFAVVCLS